MSCPVLIVTGVGLGRAVAVGASTRVGVGTGVALGGGVGEAGTSVGDAAGSEPHAATISASTSSPPNRPVLMSGCHSPHHLQACYPWVPLAYIFTSVTANANDG